MVVRVGTLVDVPRLVPLIPGDHGDGAGGKAGADPSSLDTS